MNKYKHIDGSVFFAEADLIKHIRSLGGDDDNELSDEFILQEAYQLGEYAVTEVKPKAMQKLVVKLTQVKFNETGSDIEREDILVGVKSIISVKNFTMRNSKNNLTLDCRKISSREAMATSNYVQETVAEIYALINS